MSRRRMALLTIGLVVVAAGLWAAFLRLPQSTSKEAASNDSSRRERLSGRGDKGSDLAGTLRGRITMASGGAPVVGAVVAVAALWPQRPSASQDIVVVTGSTGEWAATEVPSGLYAVSATFPSLLATHRGDVRLGPGETKTGIDLALAEGGIEVNGKVSDISGGAISGAKVTFMSGEMLDSSEQMYTALSDGEGDYRLRLTPGPYRRFARHEAYAVNSGIGEVAAGVARFDFALVPGGSIAGRVVTGDGSPVAGATVSSNVLMGFSATSDSSGRFLLQNLMPGAIELSGSARGLASRRPTLVEVGIGESIEGVTVVLDRAYTVSGVVQLGKTRTGVSGTLVWLMKPMKPTGLVAQLSLDDGSFEVLGVPPGSYFASVVSRGYVPEVGTKVEVIDRDISDLVFTLRGGATLRGRVEPPTSASLKLEASVLEISTDPFVVVRLMQVAGATTEDGEFELSHAPSGSFELVAKAQDGRIGKLPVVIAGVDVDGLVIKLEERATLTGKVLDATRAPVGGVEVYVESDELFSDYSATTRDDGSFRIVGLAPGKRSIVVRGQDGSIAWADPKDKANPAAGLEIDVALGTNSIELVVEPRDGVILGRVLGPDKSPAVDVWVSATKRRPTDKGDEAFSASLTWMRTSDPVLTDAQGRFAFRGLRRGSYKIEAEGKGAMRAQARVATGAKEVVLSLVRMQSLVGQVTAGGKPLTSYELQCVGPRHIVRTIEDPQGSYRLDRMLPGKYECQVKTSVGGASGRIALADKDATLNLVLGDFATVSGQVVNARTGEPLPGLRVLVMKASNPYEFTEAMMRPQTTKTDGRFSVDRVAAGSQTLLVFDKGFHPVAEKELELTPGQRIDVGTLHGLPTRTAAAGDLGMRVTESGSALRISDVVEGGPAASVGLKVGAMIEAVDGKPVTHYDKEARLYLFGDGVEAGQRIRIRMRGSSKEITVVARPHPETTNE